MIHSSYDKLDTNVDILLDLPFREGVGAVTADLAKPHHPVALKNTPTWEQLESLVGVITFDGAAEYLDCAAASAADLDFTSGDYSIGCWLKWSSEDESQIVIGRYVVDTSGWENYLYEGDTTRLLTTRHHHAAGDAVRTACYSGGWTQDVWWFLGISRSGSSVTHYRNGEALSMSCSAGGIVDPESNSSDLVVGVRTTKDDNYFNGSMYRMRVWSRAIELAEWARIYDHEKHWFE